MATERSAPRAVVARRALRVADAPASSDPAAGAASEERMLALRARDVPDLLARIGVLVSRRGGSLRSAVAVRDGDGGCALALVVSGSGKVLTRLPLWIHALADVHEVRDLCAPRGDANASSTLEQEDERP